MLQIQKWAARNMPITLALAKEIRMEVVFGTPSQNCIGSGVCMVMSRLPRRSGLWCPHAPAWISYEVNELKFRFVKSEVNREDAIPRLNSRFFLMRETFQLPQRAAMQLGLPTPWVRPGLYPLAETSKEWILSVGLNEDTGNKIQKKHTKSRAYKTGKLENLLQEE